MTTPLQRVLYADFLGALATVVVMVLAAGLLSSHVGIPAWGIQGAGVLLVPFVVFVFRTARSEAIGRGRVLAIMVFNVCWFFASIAWLAWGTLTLAGTWIVALQAFFIVPLVFVEVSALVALRRSPPGP